MKAKDKLRVNWSKLARDLVINYPLGFQTKCDGAFLAHTFTEEFTASLEARGYDVTTLRFSIEPKAGNENFASQRLLPGEGSPHPPCDDDNCKACFDREMTELEKNSD